MSLQQARLVPCGVLDDAQGSVGGFERQVREVDGASEQLLEGGDAGHGRDGGAQAHKPDEELEGGLVLHNFFFF